MNRVLPLFALFAFACSNSASVPAPAAAPRAGGESPSQVVARIDGEELTLADIEKPILGELRSKEQAHLEEMHQLRASSLERMVAEKLIEKAAEKRGVTPDQLLEQEVFSKVAEPTEEEIQAFYDRLRGTPGLPRFEQAKDRIVQILGQEKAREATQAFFDELRGSAQVEILLEEPEMPRVEVAATGPSRGPENAPVTIVEFSDFECPYCSRANETLAQIAQTYGDKVRVVFRDFPLSFHQNAKKAAEAGHCADDQGKFWEMHDKMFANQRALDVESLKSYAKEIGLDEAAFNACLDGGEKAALVQANIDAAMELGVRGTPAFFVNGRMVAGALPFSEFQKIIDKELETAAR